MNTVKRTRRVLAGLAGLALGLVAAFAAASPAQAQEPLPPLPFDGCGGTNLLLPGVEGGAWTVTVAGETFFPLEGDEQPASDEVVNLFIPAGAGEITWSLTIGEDETLSGTHTWTEPEGGACDRFPAPTHTQPTCDAPGTITVPEFPPGFGEGVERPDLISAVEQEVTAAQAQGPVSEGQITAFFQLDGRKVEAGSTHEVEPGTHEVTLHLVSTFLDVRIEIILHRWVIEIEEPECPGEGGELPTTGVPTGLLAGAAALLLTAGAGMYLVARRRRITFSA